MHLPPSSLCPPQDFCNDPRQRQVAFPRSFSKRDRYKVRGVLPLLLSACCGAPLCLLPGSSVPAPVAWLVLPVSACLP